jgi:SEC-C motif domain protein
MRSRFSAYALRDLRYLTETWDPSTRPGKLEILNDDLEWTRLEIIGCKKGAATDSKGIVEFRAYYRSGEREQCLHEISRFRKFENRWVYVDGTVKSAVSVGQTADPGRNAPCPCGSGKKVKRCCGAAPSGG